MTEDWDGLLLRSEAALRRCIDMLNQSDTEMRSWESRAKLSLSFGENYMAEEALFKKLECLRDSNAIREKIQTAENYITHIKEQIKIQNAAIVTSYPIKVKSNSTNPKSVEVILSEIDGLIGLDNIKNEVRSVINSLNVRKLRTSAGLSNPEISNHMVFYGNPGTGKTTIARRLGEIYNSLGVLSKGHFVETDRGGLVGGYLGQTAIKTTQIMTSALGGILFIDEAYTLAAGDNSDQYGQEAIDTILKFMEDHRDDLVVIAAGYEDLMSNFIESNPGLKSRFNKYFHFKDYTPDQLLEIFHSISKNSNYSLQENANDHLKELIEELVSFKKSNFGNGRTMRNLFERSIANQANRIVQGSLSSKDDLTKLLKEDIKREDMLEIAK